VKGMEMTNYAITIFFILVADEMRREKRKNEEGEEQ
jgi:hypothetical protein